MGRGDAVSLRPRRDRWDAVASCAGTLRHPSPAAVRGVGVRGLAAPTSLEWAGIPRGSGAWPFRAAKPRNPGARGGGSVARLSRALLARRGGMVRCAAEPRTPGATDGMVCGAAEPRTPGVRGGGSLARQSRALLARRACRCRRRLFAEVECAALPRQWLWALNGAGGRWGSEAGLWRGGAAHSWRAGQGRHWRGGAAHSWRTGRGRHWRGEAADSWRGGRGDVPGSRHAGALLHAMTTSCTAMVHGVAIVRLQHSPSRAGLFQLSERA
jgi:hypothetical protein